jgi:hypothetical protein
VRFEKVHSLRKLGIVFAFLVAMVVLVSSSAARPDGLVIGPGQAVKFASGLRCSFTAQRIANSWFRNDAAYRGPTAFCGPIAPKRWVTMDRKGTRVIYWTAYDAQYNNHARWNEIDMGPANLGPGSKVYGINQPRAPFRHVRKVVRVGIGPDTWVNFSRIGISCAVLTRDGIVQLLHDVDSGYFGYRTVGCTRGSSGACRYSALFNRVPAEGWKTMPNGHSLPAWPSIDYGKWACPWP